MDQFLNNFLPRLGQLFPGSKAILEAVADGYKVVHPEADTIILDSEPNFSVSVSVGGLDTPMTFIMQATSESDALERVCTELKEHSMDGYFESEEPEFPEDYIETPCGWIRSDHVTVAKYDGKNVWAGMVPEYMLSYLVYGDSSGMSDEELAETRKFEEELAIDGIHDISPECGPDGEFWKTDNDNYRTPDCVLCSAMES